MTEKKLSAGAHLSQALQAERPLQMVGTINAFTALLSKDSGFRAIYLSGAGVANASHGLPDLGVTTLHDILEDTRRITSAVNLPLLVDIDTGWGSTFTIARTIREMIKAGAAAIHIEDQEQIKRCGHRPGKILVDRHEMVDRIKAAVDAKTDPSFIIMARTDALVIEGLAATLDRINYYIEAGADMIFFEGVTELAQYQAATQQCAVPLLANITEFGQTPLFTQEELAKAGVSIILYPLSAFRAMNAAAEQVYQTIRQEGSQKNMLVKMQTRERLYDILNYHAYEEKLDEIFRKEKNK
jgi:methylisocitrate lyase